MTYYLALFMPDISSACTSNRNPANIYIFRERLQLVVHALDSNKRNKRNIEIEVTKSALTHDTKRKVACYWPIIFLGGTTTVHLDIDGHNDTYGTVVRL